MEGKGNETIELMSTRDEPVRDVVESKRMRDERIGKVLELKTMRVLVKKNGYFK
jgi:hypothetical protein